jgi:two-component system, LytTR family, response regulator
MKSNFPIRAVIVEDEPLARQTINDFVAGEKWLKIVGETSDGDQAVSMIDELKPDLVFLDVRIPGLTGLEVLQRVHHDPEVVFTTAHSDHAITAFELEAVDYILKPFGRRRFRQALDRVQRRLIGNAQTSGEQPRAPRDNSTGYLTRLFVRDARARIIQVRVAEVTRLLGADDYVELFAHNTSYLARLTLNQFEERLDPKRFRRIHRSAIVNLDHLVSCREVDRRLAVKLSDGSEVVASRSGSQSLRELLV